jgi:hypothetical protein
VKEESKDLGRKLSCFGCLQRNSRGLQCADVVEGRSRTCLLGDQAAEEASAARWTRL